MAAIQLYSAMGYHVITTASPQHHDYLRSLGAHVLLNYRDANVVEQVKNAANNRLCYAYDCVGDDKVLESLTRDHPAHIAYIARMTVPEGLPQNVTGHVVFLGGAMTNQDLRVSLFTTAPPIVERLILENRLLPPNLEIFNGVEEVADALKRQKHGVSATKVIIKF